MRPASPAVSSSGTSSICDAMMQMACQIAAQPERSGAILTYLELEVAGRFAAIGFLPST